MQRRHARTRPVLTRAILTVAVVVSLVAGSIVIGATAPTTAAAAPNPLRILPLGDSITSGINGHDSYRYPLGQSLAASQCGYDFVGGLRGWYDTAARASMPSSTAGFTDQDHEGHAGFTTGQILDAVPGWVSALSFDAVLLHAGQNDFFYSVAPQAATVSRDRLGSIIDALRARNPDVIVMVAKPIKAGNFNTGTPGVFYSSARVDELAGLVDGLAAAKTTPASPVISVDLNTGFQTSWLYDNLHPDATGDAWMADRWKAALTPYLTCGVAPANQAPTITNPGARTSTQGTAIAPLAITAADPDAGQTLSYSATGLPAGLTINAATGAVTGTPTTVGSSTVTVTVADNGTPVRTATATFTWAVTAPGTTNQAPTVTNPGARTSTQGTAIAPLAITASDPDAGQTLTYSATGLPAGLTIAPTTGTITGTPTTASTSTVTVTVTDNGSPVRTATATFTWTVTAPTGIPGAVYRAVNLNGPAITAGGIAFESGTTAPNFTAGPNAFCNQAVPLTPATDTSTATMLRCSNWGGGSPGARLTMTNVPNGTYQASFYAWEDNASQTFNLVVNGTTAAANVVSGPAGTWKVLGPYPVTVTNGSIAANTTGGDANLSGVVVRTTAPAPANQAPTVTNPGARTSTQGSAIAPVAITAADPDAGQTLTYSATGLPAGLAIGPTTGTITGTPTTVGSSTVTVTVTDNGTPVRTATATFTWTVTAPSTTNQTPTITNPGARTSTQGTAIAPLAITAADPDAGQTLTYSATGLPAGLTIAPTTGTITGTPTTASTSTVTVTVTDNGTPVRTATATFTWTVTAPSTTNQTPTITNPGARTSTQGTAIAPLAITAADPDAGQTLTYSATGLPAGLAIAPTTGTITGTPTTASTSTVTVTVTDNGTPVRTATATFTWTVTAPTGTPGVVLRAVNLNGPAITAGGIAFESGTTAPNFTAGPNAFCNQAVPLVPATDASTASMIRCSNWGTGSNGARATMSTVPLGTYQVSLYVWEDNYSETFSLTVNSTTVAPSVTSGPAGTWKLLGPYPVTVINGTIAVSTSGGAANLSGIVVRTAGTAPTNQAPTITNPGARTSTQGTPIAPLAITASDPDAGQTLSYSATGLPAGLTIAPTTGTITGTPTTVGTTTATVTVTDNGSPVRTATATFTWAVTAPGTTNQAPTITNPGARTSTQGTPIAPLAITAADPDAGQTLSYSATGLPAGLTINAATGAVTGTPTTVGTSTVNVTVTDNGTPVRTATATFTWTVTAPTGGPLLYRAVNLNGPAITAGGVAFESGTAAPDFTAGPNAFCNQAVPLTPATDAGTASMIRCSNWGTGSNGARATMSTVPLGTYQVSLYVWEDNYSESFDVTINAVRVANGVVSGPAGSWKLLGPFPVTVINGTIDVSTSGGAANLSGMVVTSSATTVVAVTAPAEGTSLTRPTTVSGTATDNSGIDHVHVRIRDTATGQYWNGTAFQATSTEVSATIATPGAGTTAWSYEFDPPTISGSPYQLTATAHGQGGGESAPVTRTFSLTTGSGGGGPFDPAKVTDEFVAGGNWNQPVSADFLPNGHMLVLTLPGQVHDVNPATGAQSLVLDITAKVWNVGEAGALDLMVDPAGTGYYVYYALEGSDRMRISRFTLGSSAEQVIWTNPGPGNPSSNNGHLGGSMNIGPDGKLYLGVGDRFVGSSNDLTNIFGKILRINTDGTVPADNPFFDGAGPNIDEIWAIGFRNPFRGSFDEATGHLWVGDVGGNIDAQAYEEVNIVERGGRYGWPTCEGPLGPPKNGPTCPAGVTGPVFSYPHDLGANQYFNKAIVGGEVYHGSLFPLEGFYVYADYPTDTVSWVQLAADGRTAVDDGLLHVTDAPTPVWLAQGPDGAIYYMSIGFSSNGQLRRLGYSGATNPAPVITTATATPTQGAAPLDVAFTGVATDPDGTPVTYAWDFGDGTASTVASPVHTYAAAGTYRARLRVTSGGTTVSSDIITVTVGRPPVATITSPADGTTFDAGASITITGTGSDPDTGPLPASALSWSIQFLHNDHAHPAATGSGSSITLPIPTTGHDYTGNTRYRVELTVTDGDGLKTTTAIILRPNKTGVAVASNQATTMTVDGITQTLPHTIDTLIGFQHTISVPATQCTAGQLWTFSSWSDGGARTHAVTVAAGLSLTATYTAAGTTC